MTRPLAWDQVTIDLVILHRLGRTDCDKTSGNAYLTSMHLYLLFACQRTQTDLIR